MWTEQDYQEALDDLYAPSPRTRAIVLRQLTRDPTGDPRIIPHLERYLDDRTVTLLSIPQEYGEIRWLAAAALALELQAISKPRPIVLENIPQELSADGVGLLAEEHFGDDYAKIRGNSPDPFERYATIYTALRDAGVIPLVKKVVFDPYPDTIIVD